MKKLRALQQPELYIKRIGQICGQSFVDNAVAVDCQHDDIKLSGWIAKPSFTRAQNDLCYSYVNERMMRRQTHQPCNSTSLWRVYRQ